MSETLMLPLRPTGSKAGASDTLLDRILQINQQRGDIRNLTEQSLLEEIAAKPSIDEDNDQGDSEDGSGEDDTGAESRPQKLMEGREEILRQIDIARNEAFSALDLISLLLTKHNSRLAESSMSPFLKQNIPSSSMDSQKARNPGPSTAEKRKIELVSNGWKLESISTSAERLLGASSRLQTEATRESKYWEQISRIKAEGWSVCKVPQERHTLGVRFGFQESSPAFRNCGFAALRSKDDGSLYLDRGPTSTKHRAVRVSVLEDGQEIGASFVPADDSVDSEAIEDDILQARNSLYEEELFHEANREARAVASLGFSTGHNVITFDLKQSRQVVFRLVKLSVNPQPAPDGLPLNSVAEAIVLSLRLLLSYTHRKNHERRTRPPPPMTTKPRAQPEYALLRPVLCLLQHRNHFEQLAESLQTQLKPLEVAGLPTSATTTPLGDTLSSIMTMTRASEDNDQWLDSLISRLESTISLSLPSTRNLTIQVRSLLGPPILGTEFTISEISWPSLRLPQSRHNVFSECQTSLTQILLQDLSVTIESITIPANPDASDSSDEKVVTLRWEPTRPFSNTFLPCLAAASPNSQLQFRLTSSSLLLRYVIATSSSETTSKLAETQSKISETSSQQNVSTYAWLSNGSVKRESSGGKREDISGMTLEQAVRESLVGLRNML